MAAGWPRWPGEFTSTTFPFAAQAGRGVTITELAPDQLVSAAGDFDVVTASLVQSANGAVLDIDALRHNVSGTDTFRARTRFGHGHVSGTDTLTVIDVTQALGWKLLDVGARPVSVPRFAPARRASGFISTTPTTTWTVCWTLCVSEA
jgi:hypothetical protein